MMYGGLIIGLILLAVVFISIIFLAGIFVSLQGFLISILQGFFSAAPSVAGLVGFALMIWLVIRFVLKFSGANKFFGWSVSIMFVYLILSQTWVAMLNPEVRARFNLASKNRTNEAVQGASDGLLSGVEESRIYVAKSDLVAYLDSTDLSKTRTFFSKTIFYRLRKTVPAEVFLSEADWFVRETDGRPGHFLASGEKMIILLSDLENVKVFKEREMEEKALADKERQKQAAINSKKQEQARKQRRNQVSILTLKPFDKGGERAIFRLPPETKYGDSFQFLESVAVTRGDGMFSVGYTPAKHFQISIPAGFVFSVPAEAVRKDGFFEIIMDRVPAVQEIKIKKKGGT